MPLQHALAAGNPENVSALIALLKESPDALLANLVNKTKDGFMPLQQALAAGNPENVKALIALLKESPDALVVNFENRTQDGFMPLQGALKSGNPENVKALITLLEGYPDALHENLSNQTGQKFNLLHHGALTHDKDLFFKIIHLIRKTFVYEAEDFIKTLANQKNKKGYYPRSAINKEIEDFLKSYRQPQASICPPYTPFKDGASGNRENKRKRAATDERPGSKKMKL